MTDDGRLGFIRHRSDCWTLYIANKNDTASINAFGRFGDFSYDLKGIVHMCAAAIGTNARIVRKRPYQQIGGTPFELDNADGFWALQCPRYVDNYPQDQQDFGKDAYEQL